MFSKIYAFIFLFSFSLFYTQTRGDRVLGTWLATDHSVAVGIFKSGSEYKAKILWFDPDLGSGTPLHTRLDHRNPKPELRKRKIIGMEILEGLVYNAKNQIWEKGKIYDASSGKFWDSSAHLTADGLLKVRGFWKFSWMGKSLTFKRTNLTNFTKL